jgi:hypothetical protein
MPKNGTDKNAEFAQKILNSIENVGAYEATQIEASAVALMHTVLLLVRAHPRRHEIIERLDREWSNALFTIQETKISR